jgi:hypothetical protein
MSLRRDEPNQGSMMNALFMSLLPMAMAEKESAWGIGSAGFCH